jgi:hypothetical protein
MEVALFYQKRRLVRKAEENAMLAFAVKSGVEAWFFRTQGMSVTLGG